MSHPFTDVVIPIHGALEYVQKCVASVEAKTENYRFIFVDDYSDRATTDFLLDVLARHPQALLVRTAKQRWFTRAVNLGLRLVRTNRCMVLNSDCEVDTGWLEELYAVWEEVASAGHRVAIVGSVLSGEEPRRYALAPEPDYVTGHALLVDMAALTDISCRRGTPGIYLNEHDQSQIHIASERMACWDLNKAGYVNVKAFKSLVGHHFAKSWGADLGRVMSLRLQDVD